MLVCRQRLFPPVLPCVIKVAGSACGRIVAIGLLAALASSPCFAQRRSAPALEDAEVRFVEAMRERGYFDLTLDYLTRAKAAPETTSAALLARLPYEQAVTQLEQARTLTGDERDAAVSAAKNSLEAFLNASDNKQLAAEGSSRLAAALAADGLLTLAGAKKVGGDQDAARAQARQSYEEARKLYQQSEKQYDQALDDYKAVKPGSSEAALRLRLRIQLAGVRVTGSRMLYEQAKTYSEESSEFKQLNEKAAKELLGHYDKYYEFPVGLYSHLYEGWCYQALGQHKLAMGCFEDLITQDPEDPSFRTLITLGHTYLTKSLVAQEKHEKALEQGEAWLEELPRSDQLSPAGGSLKYQLGEAAVAAARAASGNDQRRLYLQASEWLRESSRTPNEFQADARKQLATVNRKLGTETESSLETFADAYQTGRNALLAIRPAGLSGDGEEEAAELRRKATVAYQAALLLVEQDTEVEKLNEVRHALSYLYWESKDYLQAAAIAEFLARNYSEDRIAEKSARLALASLDALFMEAAAEGGVSSESFEAQQLTEFANFITRQWSGQQLADTGFSLLMKVALQSGNLAAARSAIQEVPEARRTPLELRLAAASWEQAKRQSATAGDDLSARSAAQQARDTATKLLAEVFAKARNQREIDQSTATVALYLSQAMLDAGEASGAIKLLEDKKVGPLALVSAKAAAVDRPGYSAEAYKAALRAYVSATPPQTEDALKTMNQLEQAVGDGDAAEQTLRRIYLGLGLQLQQQIKELTAAGKQQEASRVVKAFAVFLERLRERSGDADWVNQQWIGQTFFNLGEGLATGSGSAADASPQRKSYYERAAEVFGSMIDRAKQQPDFLPSENSLLAARLQLAQSQRKMGNYAEALDTFSSILLEKQTILDVQKAAAYTFQEWGADGNPEQLKSAVGGGRTVAGSNKKLIWGWSKMAQIVGRLSQKQPKYKDLYFECWLNVAKCRYLGANQKSGAERDKYLSSARRTIRSMAQQYPNLGGPERQRDFDRLLKQVQQLDGKEPVGLAEFK